MKEFLRILEQKWLFVIFPISYITHLLDSFVAVVVGNSDVAAVAVDMEQQGHKDRQRVEYWGRVADRVADRAVELEDSLG